MFVIFFVIVNCLQVTMAISRVAVIGGGIGGTSAAYFLKQKMSNNVEIDLIDDGDDLGGRLATVHVPGVDREYEIGGSIIHSSNKLMVNFMKMCRLKKKFHPSSPLTIHKDGKIVFQEWGYPWLDAIRLGMRFGIQSSYKLGRFVDKLLSSFSSIYDELDNPDSYFKTVKEMLQSMSPEGKMMNLTRVTLTEELLSLDLNPLLIDGLATLATMSNYGQMPDSLHAFVGFVSLVGTGGSLFSVHGGNKQIASCNLRNSRATHIKGRAVQVSRKSDAFTLKIEFADGSPAVVEDYDAVILSAPQTSDLRSIKLPEEVNEDFPGNYHRKVTTIIS